MPNPQRKRFWITTAATFVVLFNVGYVFHDLLFGEWFHSQQPYAREHYIVPYIALAFAAYALLLAHLYPIYRAAYPNRRPWAVGLQFGVLMGVLFDALQGGFIELATLPMPMSVFFVDSGYHVFVEGPLAGAIATVVYERVTVPR